jgi:hypothetical protein
MKQTKTLPIKKAAPLGVASGDLFSDFVAWLKRNKAKLRAGCKMTVDTGTFKTASLPTIEVKVAAFSNKWMPLKMPEGNWYFKSVAERDAMLTKIEWSLIFRS